MLALRPMLAIAAAFLAGTAIAREWPGVEAWLLFGWLALIPFVLWFFLRREQPLPEPLPGMPVEYAAHIGPKPGWLARRGMEAFLLLLGAASLLSGMTRQIQWEASLEKERARLPAAEYFTAWLVAEAPSAVFPGAKPAWRVPARLVRTNEGDLTPTRVLLSSRRAGGTPGFRRGDLLKARVRLERNRRPDFPGAFDHAAWLERQGLSAELSLASDRRGKTAAQSFEVVRLDDVSVSVGLMRRLDDLRGQAVALTLANGGREMGGILAAMLYGVRDNLDADTRDVFRRVGIGHVLAISGLHVGLVVGLFWWLGAMIGLGRRRLAAFCMAVALLYLGLSGGQVAAVRATAMALAHLGSVCLGRRANMLNSLALAAFVIVLANPSATVDISFQLSFVAVVFIFLGMRRGEENPLKTPRPEAAPAWRRFADRVGREIRELTKLSVATWFGLFPLIAMYFAQMNLIGLILNIAVIPLMSLVLAGGLLLPAIGWIPGMAWLLNLPAELLMWLAEGSDRIPYGSFPIHPPGLFWTWLFYAAFAMLMLKPVVPKGRPVLVWNSLTWAIIIFSSLAISLDTLSVAPPSGGRISLLPGRGMGVLVAESPTGETVVAGELSRDGWNEAKWLHFLKVRGPVAVMDCGRSEEGRGELPALAYHFGISATLSPPPRDKAREWSPVPGCPGTEIAVSYGRNGSPLWLAARAGRRSSCVTGRMAWRQFTYRMEKRLPGFDAELLLLRLSGDSAAAAELGAFRKGLESGVSGRVRGVLPEGWFRRDEYGVLLVDDGIRGFDGREWREIAP